MSIKEIFYLSRDNTVDLILRDDSGVTDLTDVTKVEVIDIGCAWSVDSDSSPDSFDIGGADGALVLKFGQEPIPAGSYKCKLIVYDPTNTHGIVWGDIYLTFKSFCPAG